MSVLVIGDEERASAFADGLADAGCEARAYAETSDDVGALATHFVELEGLLECDGDPQVVCVGRGSAVLAAVLVATRLGVPVAAAPGDPADAGPEAAIVAALAGERVADLPQLVAWARERGLDPAADLDSGPS